VGWSRRLRIVRRNQGSAAQDERRDLPVNDTPLRLGLTEIAVLAVLCCALGGWLESFDQRGGNVAPPPNWTEPTQEELHEAAEADREGKRAPKSGEIGFSFTLAESARATSAGVYDGDGRLVRTLWSARPYGAGTHYALWDGMDDEGNLEPAARYTIKVLYGNVRYDWEGPIGVTEDSLAGPHNWDATASFPSGMVFLNGKAYVAGGYEEGKIEAYVFDEKTPFTVSPLNMALTRGGQFAFTATDGNRIYFVTLHYLGNGSNAVVAFEPDGRPYSFPEGTVIPEIGHLGAFFVNTRTDPWQTLKGLRGLDVAYFRDTKITGLGVERKGDLLATAHGARDGVRLTPSLDQIDLWDKNSGAARGKITGITNPQKMAFDLNGDLWVIEGGPVVEWYWDRGARLVRIHDVGGKNQVSEPIAGLENPVDVQVSPVNGHIFVADGGASQQVKEFDPATGKLLSALGKPGGYGQGAECDANIEPDKFWLDFNARSTGFTQPWISIDEGGDVWVGDFTTGRLMRFHSGTLVTEIEVNRWSYVLSVPQNDPTRFFGGPNGMLEYKIDYGVPLEPTDPLDPRAPHSWHAVRNWFPCFLQAEAGKQPGTTAWLLNTEKFSNGQTIGMVGYHGGPYLYDNALVNLPESGRIAAVNNRITPFRGVWFDAKGDFYRFAGSATTPPVTINRFSLTGYDAQGFPEWDTGSPIASFTPNPKMGDPTPACWYDGCDFQPTEGGMIPIYAGPDFNRVVEHGVTAFHLGGLPLKATALAWKALPEKPIRYPDGHGTYSALKNNNEAFDVRVMHHDIFAGVNGNWQLFSCQFFQYHEDGLLVGQFGWRGSDEYPGLSWGRPDPWRGQALAPGFCGNPIMFKMVQVGKDYYLYTGDEGYRAGPQRWKISNLDSIHEITGTASMGASVELKDAARKRESE
jgi:hypothetical protein